VVRKRDQIVSQTGESIALSKELKRRGWTFVGPTTCYALMQATGMVNDHLRSCDAWSKVDRARRRFERPS
jgi:DNA-3-methyladenine glycosylase I